MKLEINNLVWCYTFATYYIHAHHAVQLIELRTVVGVRVLLNIIH